MLRLFAWMVAAGTLLGPASLANAQDPQAAVAPAPGTDSGYTDVNAYTGITPAEALAFNPVGAGYSVPVVGSHKTCFTLYPLSVTYPYSYTGPGSAFGAYRYVPYPYAPIGYGWFGEYWRGW
jgi:hypothetical protein